MKSLRVFILLAGILLAWTVRAADSDLDAAFSGNGHLHTDFGYGDDEAAGSVLLQPDGKLLLAGYMTDSVSSYQGIIVRYQANGNFDSGFAGSGRLEFSHTESGLDLLLTPTAAVQADGKIVMAGVLTNATLDEIRLLVLRRNADGTPDTTFGDDGYVTHAVPSYGLLPHRLFIQADGKYLLAGDAIGVTRRVFAARLHPDGSFDTDFGTDGYTLLQPSPGDEHYVAAAALQMDGRLLIAGDYEDTTEGDYDSFILRVTAGGEPDPEFSGAGVLVDDYHPAGSDGINSILLGAEGDIFAVGDVSGATADSHSLVVKLDAGGSPASDFGVSGVRILTEISERDYAGSGVLLPDGKLLLAGDISLGDPDGTIQPMVVRLLPDGDLDTAFNTTGYKVYDIAPAGGRSGFYRAHYLPGGRIALAGDYAGSSGADRDLLLAVLTGHAYDLQPAAFSFTDESAVDENVLVTSGVVEVAGIPAGTPVAVGVSGGEYRIGSGDWTEMPGHARAGDQIAVRHTSAASPGTTTDTVLTVGGFFSVSNRNLMLGNNRSDTFSSTSKSAVGGNGGGTPAPGGGGGGGSTGWLLFAVLGLLAWCRPGRDRG